MRVVASWAGLDAASVGGASLRIGGATDLYARYGGASARVIKERGRWDSDIHFVYARPSATAHLAASREVGDACDVDLEAAFPEWSQPTRF